MDETQSEIVESGNTFFINPHGHYYNLSCSSIGMLRRRCADRALNTDIRLVTPIKAMMDELEKFGTISTMFTDNTNFQNDPINFLVEKLRKWQDKRQNQQFIRSFDDWFGVNVTAGDCEVLNTCSEVSVAIVGLSGSLRGFVIDISTLTIVSSAFGDAISIEKLSLTIVY